MLASSLPTFLGICLLLLSPAFASPLSVSLTSCASPASSSSNSASLLNFANGYAQLVRNEDNVVGPSGETGGWLLRMNLVGQTAQVSARSVEIFFFGLCTGSDLETGPILIWSHGCWDLLSLGRHWLQQRDGEARCALPLILFPSWHRSIHLTLLCTPSPYPAPYPILSISSVHRMTPR